MLKKTHPFVWVENHESVGFFDFELKKCVATRLRGAFMGQAGTSTYAIYAFPCHFCYFGGFGRFGDFLVLSLRGVGEEVVTAYAY